MKKSQTARASSPQLERKYIDLAQLKAVSEEGSGGFEGYANNFGILDSYGDISLPGAYTDTLEQFKACGWSTTDHSWGVKDEIGIITEAHEDEKGLFFKSEFHPSDDAQQIRLKVNNRLAKGKAVRLSIGYIADEVKYVSGQEAIKYLTPDQAADQAVLARLKLLPRVRLLVKITLFEVSIVSVPAEHTAAVTAAKSAEAEVIARALSPAAKAAVEAKAAALHAAVKGIFETALEARTNSFWNLVYVLENCIWNATWDDQLSEINGLDFDLETILREILSEFAERVISSLVKNDEEEDAGDVEATSSNEATEAKGKRAAAAWLTQSRSEDVVTTVQGFVEKMKKNAANRTKEGRVLSQANREKVKNCVDALQELLDASEAAKEAPLAQAVELLRLELENIEADITIS